LMGLMLTASIMLLVWRLKVKQRIMQDAGVANVFGKEVKNLLIILIIFCPSFLLRFIADEWFVPMLKLPMNHSCVDPETNYAMLCDFYPPIIYLTITQYFWDFIPISAILLFHYFNFKGKS